MPLETPTPIGVWSDGNGLDQNVKPVTNFCLMMENLFDAGWDVFKVAPGDGQPTFEEMMATIPYMVQLHSYDHQQSVV